MKVAKLVYVSFATRVICDENASDEQIIELARPRIREGLQNMGDNIEEIIDDTDSPFDPEFDN